MARRRSLLAILLLAMSLHVWFIARTLLPAQDGLKFIRVARQFQTDTWTDVIRGTDVHPLYPSLVAIVEPVVTTFTGHGPDGWRIAAQLVASMASVGLLVPVYFLTAVLFDRRIAFVAAGLLALLPRVAEVGHDTLADSLGLFSTFLALWLGAMALKTGNWRTALGSGLAAGAGYPGAAGGHPGTCGHRSDRIDRPQEEPGQIPARATSRPDDVAGVSRTGSDLLLRGQRRDL